MLISLSEASKAIGRSVWTIRDAGLRGELAITKRGTFPTGWHVDLEQLITHFEKQRRNYLNREHRPRGRDKTKRKAKART